MRTLALCLTMTCAACGTVQEIPGPNLQLAQECDKLPGKLPLPKQNVKGKVVLSEAMDGMKKLNGRIDAKDECYRDQVQTLFAMLAWFRPDPSAIAAPKPETTEPASDPSPAAKASPSFADLVGDIAFARSNPTRS
jgi:hypothetical protein